MTPWSRKLYEDPLESALLDSRRGQAKVASSSGTSTTVTGPEYRLGRPVALKVIGSRATRAMNRFRLEARAV